MPMPTLEANERGVASASGVLCSAEGSTEAKGVSDGFEKLELVAGIILWQHWGLVSAQP